MEFKTASEVLTGGVRLRNIARECGVSENLLQRARMDPAASSYRKPPNGWEEVIVRLTRERVSELMSLLSELESRQHDPGGEA